MRMPASRTIPGLVDELAERFADREALVGLGRRYTYRELRGAIREVARGLHALGVRRGDKVAILMGNRPEWVITALAITTLGAVMVGVNTWVTARELEFVLHDSDTIVLVAADRFLRHDYLAMLAEIEPRDRRLPLLRQVVCDADALHHGMARFSELIARGADIPPGVIDAAGAAVGATDVAYLLYTSGSTSTPKGVQLQHYALIENMWQIGERMHVTERDRLWLAVSLFWGLGCENALFNLLTHGGCVVLQEHFEPGEALQLIEQERCTVFYGTPNMALALAEHPRRAQHDLSSLRTGGTIGTPEQIMRVVDLGAREICNIYGLTETYGNCAVTDAHDPLEARLATVGRPLDGVTIRIVDVEKDLALTAGEVGEIRVKGYVTCGYYKRDSRDYFDGEGWFRTGDLGYLDAEGRLHFRGRIKEIVKTGGINVAPIEVEEALMAHPAVKTAFVVGVPDPVRDEALAAVIVLRSGAAVTAAALEAHCRKTLAAYKVPRLFRFVDESELPLTVTGKLQKKRLSELFA
ncbi:MAG TPA: AMP-binding protein [Stellaceae bacterium]|nr:AMP-binding protein [Stellaceae bacterium]